MLFRWVFFILGLLALLLGACSWNAPPPVTPAADKLTFLFFYTKGWVPWAKMEPVVDGLEGVYDAQVEFRRIDANSPDGREIFQAYGLRGHPSFVVINPQGEVLWTGLGEQPEEMLAQALQGVLNNPWSSTLVISS